jgi:hypothetical protein
MDRPKRRRALIAFVIGLALIAFLSVILFFITLLVLPDASQSTRLILSIIGAAILGAAGFFSGLKDTYDFVLSIIDDFFDDSAEMSPEGRQTEPQKSPTLEHLSTNETVSGHGKIVAAATGHEANIQAQNIAGRDINIFNFAAPFDSPTTISVLSNQIDKLGESLSVQARQKLITLKNAWREGKRQETLRQLQEMRRDKEVWAALSIETRAEYLCFEGSIELHLTDNVQVAKEFADKAAALTATSNETRLRASIAFTEGKLKEAVEILTGLTDLDSLHLKAAFYLELRKPVQCLQILESAPISSNPTAETYRLRALSYLITKEISHAQLEIQKALELNPFWESIQFSAALIDFYSAISLGGFDDPIVISAEPIDWTLIKRDDQSLSKLHQAADRFQELMKLKDQTQEEINRLHVWYLACLGNHPERQDEAKLYCQSLLQENPAFAPAIRWALARSYEFNLDVSETALEEYVANDTVTVYQILTLTDCYIADEKLDEGIALLERKERVFQEQGAIGAWLHAFAQAQVLKGSPETGLRKIDSFGQDAQTYQARMLVLHALAQKTNNWEALNDFLNKFYAETGNPNVLLDICEIKAEQQDWLYIVENSEVLLNCFHTAEILRLITIAAYNTGHFQLCLQLLESNQHLYPQSKLPHQLKRMRILCQSELGILPQAVLEAENLAFETPTLENLIPLINLYIMKGDFKGLVLAARQLEILPNLPPQVALQVSRLLIWEDRKLALSLWNKATKQELPDDLVGEAFFLGNQLGLKTELKQLSLKLQMLGQEGRAGIHFGPVHELLELIREGHGHGVKFDEAYRNGSIPVHLVAKEFNVPLATLYHSRLLENEKIASPFEQPILLARHGGRMPMEGFPAPVSKLNLHLDITSVLLSEHLNILPKAEQAFAPLRIPAELIPALIQLREQITPHQPTRLEEHKQIIDLVKNGAITVLEEELSPDFNNPTLIAEMGKNWVILAEAAKKTTGFLVDYLPLRKNDLSGEPPSSLPDDIDKVLVNCRALVESLLQEGPLSIEEYRRAIDELGHEGQVDPSKTIPKQGSFLYCEAAIPESLAGINLLIIVCQRFQVHISNQTYVRIKAELDSYSHFQSVANWVDNLISRLNRGLDQKLYQIISISSDKRRQLNDIRSQHPLDGVLTSLLGFEIQEGDLIWTDDRWFNTHRHRDGVPIADVCDVLKFLVGLGQMSEAEYYRALYKLRSGNVIFIPIQRDEIVYHLKQAQIQPTEGTVVETQQLKVLRQYAASSLLHKTIMQKPPMPPGSANDQGEIAFVINFMRAVSWALFDIWVDSSLDEENRPILCEWIINNLYLDYLALFRTVSFPVEEENQTYQAALGLITILTAPFTSATGFSNTKSQSRKAYISWLYQRLLQRRLSVDPQLLTTTLEILKDTFNRVKGDAQLDGSDVIAKDLLLQTYYDILPEPIQQELRHDTEFMSSFGLEFIPIVSINNFAFERREFFEAAFKAVNDQKAVISPVRSEIEIVFEPVENELAIKFIDPNTRVETGVKDERFMLLLDSTIEREQMLYRCRNWFDCSDIELRKAVTSILVTEDIFRRVEIAEEWRNNSTYLYYKNLYEKLREQKQIHFPNLIPPSADRLLSHYRFSLEMSTAEEFLEEFSTVSKTLLDEEGLATTVHRMIGFPISLPKPVLDEISSLSDQELTSFVRRLLKSAGSPLSKIHLIKILVHLAEQKPSLYRLARRITKSLFTVNSIAEFTAFSNLFRWVHREFGYWKEANKWQPHVHLAMVWAHTHQLFSILTAVGVPLEWIAETFEQVNRRLSTEVFNRNVSQWFDTAHPRWLNFSVFTLMGLADSIGDKGSIVFDEVLRELFVQVSFQEIGEHILPASPFLMDNKRIANKLGTFLGGAYSEKLIGIFGEELIGLFHNNEYESIADQAITSLIENPHDFSSWVSLRIIIRDFPPYDSLYERLSQLLGQTNFVDLIHHELEDGLATMEFAAWQLTHLSNEELKQHLSVQFVKVLEYLAIQAKTVSDLKTFISDSLGLRLVEIALNIALCNQTISEAVLEFSELLSQIANSLSETRSIVKSIVQILCEELPIAQSQYFGALLLKLRTQ